VFGEIFRTNAWGNAQSASGTGSDLEQTRVIRRELPGLMRNLGVKSMLDLPCGDFHWMSQVDLSGIEYLGADIVDALVANNQALHGGAAGHREFRVLDLCADPLPPVDLLLCRDCLVHLGESDLRRALENIRRSGIAYLLTTTFPGRKGNPDIATGGWRPLNLQAPPFDFPAPLFMLEEGCTEDEGAYADKSLGLWRVADLPPRREGR
jgi:hypothetical protein